MRDVTKAEKRALREAALLAHARDRSMSREDRDVHYLQARASDLPLVIGGAVVEGVIRIEEIHENARPLIEDVAARLRAVNENLANSKPAKKPQPAYDPGAVVSVSAILDSLQILQPESTLYVNRRTGEVTIISNEFLDEEDDDAPEDEQEPAWAIERRKTRDVLSNPDWVALLDSLDISDHDAMIRFGRRAGPAASQELLAVLPGRGGHRRYREVIRRRGLENEWNEYRKQRLVEQITFLLDEEKIRYRK